MTPSMHDLPLPRLLDHMGAEDRLSDAEEEEKEAKRCRPASTTPRSTSGALPHDYDIAMGIAPVEPQESARFEEGNNSDFQDDDTAAHSQESPELPENPVIEPVGAGEFHGGYGSVSLRECLERIINPPPLLPSTLGKVWGPVTGPSSSNMTDPPH